MTTPNLPAHLTATDAAALPPSLLARLSFEESSIVGSDGQFEGVKITGCSLRRHDADGVVLESPEEALRAGLRAIQNILRPCGPDHAMRALAMLRARTKARAQDEGSDAVTAVAYADWLAEYPTDTATEACEYWARGNTWWPSWAELQRVADRMVAPRLAIRKALQDALSPPPGVLYLGKPAPETRAERMRNSINAYLRHASPHKAARVERNLAAEEKREPEEWARDVAEPPTNRPPRPKFVPGQSNTDKRVAELAEDFRRKQANPTTTQAAE